MEWMRKEVARARERIRRWNEFDNNCDVCGENFGSHALMSAGEIRIFKEWGCHIVICIDGDPKDFEGRAFGVVYPPPENPCDEDFLRAIST
jgi:hypothetical protein